MHNLGTQFDRNGGWMQLKIALYRLEKFTKDVIDEIKNQSCYHIQPRCDSLSG